jgi:nitrogenase molybdenum-iron protein alpha chain
LYNPRKSPEEIAAELEENGFLNSRNTTGLIRTMEENTLVIDDLNQYEAEKLVELMKPDLFCAGIKEKYSIQKLGVPMKQLHSYDSGGPYAGFKGRLTFTKRSTGWSTARSGAI